MGRFRVGFAAAGVIVLAACSSTSDTAGNLSPPRTGDRLLGSPTGQALAASNVVDTGVATPPTQVRFVRPVNASRRLAAGYHVGQTFATIHGNKLLPGGCFAGSTVATAVYRCFGTNNGVYDPCWAEGSPARSVLCLDAPWSRTVTRLRLSGRLAAVPRRGPALDPWGLQLSNHWKCMTVQGTHDLFKGRVVFYDCPTWSSGRVVLQGINHIRPKWWVRTATRSPQDVYRLGPPVTVVAAWYTKP